MATRLSVRIRIDGVVGSGDIIYFPPEKVAVTKVINNLLTFSTALSQ